MTAVDAAALEHGRAPCPKCGRKGVGYARHPGDARVRLRSKLSCRYCHASFRVKQPVAAAEPPA